MDNILIGKFISITLKEKGKKTIRRICKVLSIKNDIYTLVSVKTREIYMKKVQMIHHGEFNNQGVHILPFITTDYGSYVKTNVGKWWIEDFYLHRIGGPAIDSLERKYYLYGKEIEKEDYLDAMPEEVQTDMLFRLDEL